MRAINLEQARNNIVEQQVRPWDVLDTKILHMLGQIPRDAFVLDAYKSLAYVDTALPLGNGHNMMHPVVEARMLQSLDIQPTGQVLEVGTGSGYITACLAFLAAHVKSMEIDESLSQAAAARLQELDIANVTLVAEDAVNLEGGSKSYNVIAITGAMAEVSECYKKALIIGGRMFVITGEDPAMAASLITRTGENSWAQQCLFETSIQSLTHSEQKKQFIF